MSLQFPLYWFSVPAVMKGWMDRVLTQGFAFSLEKMYNNGIFKVRLSTGHKLLRVILIIPLSRLVPHLFSTDSRTLGVSDDMSESKLSRVFWCLCRIRRQFCPSLPEPCRLCFSPTASTEIST